MAGVLGRTAMDLDDILQGNPSGIITVSDAQILSAETDRVVPRGSILKVVPGGSITVPAKRTLGIKGSFKAGDYPVFYCTDPGKPILPEKTCYNAVRFGLGACKEVNSLWFGADRYGTEESATAIQNAIYSAYADYPGWGLPRYAPVKRIKAPTGFYRIDHRIISYYWNELVGDGVSQTIFQVSDKFPASRMQNGYGVIWVGAHSLTGQVGQEMHAPWVHDLYIDLTRVNRSKRITGIWGRASCRRSRIYNIGCDGHYTAMSAYQKWNKFMGAHDQAFEAGEDGEFNGTKVVGESYGAGNGSKGPYVHTAHTKLVLGSIIITAGAQVVYDNRDFGWYDGVQGYFNWDSGYMTVTFAEPVPEGTPITVDYFHSGVRTNHNTYRRENLHFNYLSSENMPYFVESNSDAEAQIIDSIYANNTAGVMNYGGYQTAIKNLCTEPTYIQPWLTAPYRGKKTIQVTVNPVAKTLTRKSGSWLTDGAAVSGILVIAGSSNLANNGQYKIATVTPLILTYSLTNAGAMAEAGNVNQTVEIWAPGGHNPQVKLHVGNTTVLGNCYWDGGGAFVLVWLDSPYSYAGVGYELLQFTGYHAGFPQPPGESVQWTGGGHPNYCERSTDTVLKTPGVNPHNTYWIGGFYPIQWVWIETASGDRYKYAALSSRFDGKDGWITVDPLLFPSGGSKPPPLPLDTVSIRYVPDQKVWYSYRGFQSVMQNLTVDTLKARKINE